MIYESMQKAFNETKPLRGSKRIPLTARRQSNETIKRIDLGVNKPDDVRYAYAANYRNRHTTTKDEAGADVITFYPNNVIGFDTNGDNTTTLASFIYRFAPANVLAAKYRNKVWIFNRNGVRYPLPVKGEAFFNYDPHTHTIKPVVTDYKIPREFVDRAKTKAERERLAPFLNYVKTFLSMSDGWVYHDTIKEFFTVPEGEYYGAQYLYVPPPNNPTMAPPEGSVQNIRAPKGTQTIMRFNSAAFFHHFSYSQFLDMLIELPADDYLYGLCFTTIVMGQSVAEDTVLVTVPATTRYPHRNWKLKYDLLCKRLYAMIAKRKDMKKIVLTDPTDKFIDKVA